MKTDVLNGALAKIERMRLESGGVRRKSWETIKT